MAVRLRCGCDAAAGMRLRQMVMIVVVLVVMPALQMNQIAESVHLMNTASCPMAVRKTAHESPIEGQNKYLYRTQLFS